MSYYDLMCQTILDLLRKRVGAILKKTNNLFFNLVLFMNLMQSSAILGNIGCIVFCKLEYMARQQELLKK